MTNEEIIAELGANEELRGQFVESFGKTEFGKTLLTNNAKNHWDANIDQTVGEIHGRYDNDIKEILGVDKVEGQKTHVFLKEQLTRLKGVADSVDPEVMSQKDKAIADLQAKLEANEGGAHYKGQFDELQSKSQSRVKELQDEIDGLQGKIRNGSIEREINRAMSGLEFNSDLPKTLIDNFVKTEIDAIMKDAQILDDGSIVYFKGGVALTDSKSLAKVTTDQLLKSRFESVLSKRSALGGGGQDDKNIDPTKKTPVSSTIASAKTKVELTKALTSELQSKGLIKGSKEWKEAFNPIYTERAKDLPLGE